MTLTFHSCRPSTQRLREARRQLLEQGAVSDGLIEPALHRSWTRSQRFGVVPNGRVPGAPHASGAKLARALRHEHELVSHARPLMEFVYEQTRNSDCMVILADSGGMLLEALGDPPFIERADRVALRPGAIWHEQWRGTNAIGTALADKAPAVVNGSEHYLERNAFLTCSAAPITDPSGRLLGAIDISGDRRSYSHHTLGLVRSAAKMIEHRLFRRRHSNHLLLRLHTQPEGLDTFCEGLIALSSEGWIVGANDAALTLLGLTWQDVGTTPIDRVLIADVAMLAGWQRRNGNQPRALCRHDGQPVWARVEASCAMPSPQGSVVGQLAVDPPRDPLAELDTGDPALLAAITRARRVIDKPIGLLVQGETGTGKEMLARALHASGPRRAGAFVTVNCAAIPESLFEAELFGYRPGAFTGAVREGAPGRIREADGGTLFLDEIGDMPLPLQVRLLRVLQEREVQPLGGGKPVPVDFRLVCATHRRLRSDVETGRFREDLYYRLNGLTLFLPPLRDRRDLMRLVQRLLNEFAPGRTLGLSPEVVHAFERYGWPGNVRQLANSLQTACALLYDDEGEICWSHLPDDLAEDLASVPQDGPVSRRDVDCSSELRTHADHLILHVTRECNGNLSEAARRLGISRNTLYRRLGPAKSGAQEGA